MSIDIQRLDWLARHGTLAATTESELRQIADIAFLTAKAVLTREQMRQTGILFAEDGLIAEEDRCHRAALKALREAKE